MPDQPLLVFGPRSLDYDFGPSHPLTPRRFGPGIGLLEAIGAKPGLAPEPALDDELLACHTRAYLDAVRHFSLAAEHGGWLEPEAGIGFGGDDPPFAGMHEAAAAVAGGSLRAMEAILRGDVEHAFHPGGGLHHAMPARASGFCIYDDPALAISLARRAGLRVLYVDLDVHHGDGVEAIHAADTGVLTISFHESGRYLFPGTGFADEIGEGAAIGSVVNVPLEPTTGERAWLAAVRTLVPELAAAFGPDVIVSQHGADSHAWDPLAHLRNTTTAMGEAARLVDELAHRRAGGRWLATGGGGYGVYDVVPRSWSQVWSAAAHRDVPGAIPGAWIDRWAPEAARYGVRQLPERFEDDANAGRAFDESQAGAERMSGVTASTVREVVVPGLIRAAVDGGWWDPLADHRQPPSADASTAAAGDVGISGRVDRASWENLTSRTRILPGASPIGDRHAAIALTTAAIEAGAIVSAAVDRSGIVALAVSYQGVADLPVELLWLGVNGDRRRRGLGRRILAAHLGEIDRAHPAAPIRAPVAAGDRDPIEPLARDLKRDVVTRLFESAGFEVRRAEGVVGRLDPSAILATRH